MRTEGKVSKVAVCKRCNKTILASHIDYISRESEKNFTELTNEGFLVKLETIAATKKRDFGMYAVCAAKECNKEVV